MLTAKTLFLHVLLLSTKHDDEVQQLDVEQALCLATNIYHEARGEPKVGQYAVAHTTMNRVNDRRYPGTVCGVITSHRGKRNNNSQLPALHRCQFSWYCSETPAVIKISQNGTVIKQDYDAFVTASIIAIKTMIGMHDDNTIGATHYYNPKLASPRWARYYTHTVTIGNHKFLARETSSPY